MKLSAILKAVILEQLDDFVDNSEGNVFLEQLNNTVDNSVDDGD